ncbi:LysR substrate-binding domain-containing protein [Sphingomonas sp. MG17]|uniref:LysR substrate-binding domain-containing protein n=1 Tax=Sphingomonas tagetis TaxID=2949092 RepID=A0A9X2HR83_9SPHN|nr:LysR substrate-binding domain-containing protein [Sphingomonas tagetis]MCP3731120.1 LysR substrate-binding domain-containing protein [Sphingomonas tagetis]
MKLSHIRDILAVAEAGSLRGASRKLGITQPTITRSIRDTENELGQSLFMRQPHGVVLTEAGHMFVRRAVAIQSEVRHIFEELEQAKGRFVGQVSIAVSAAASISIVPTVLQKFYKRFPQALLRVSESLLQPIESDILSGEIDFFVGPLYENRAAAGLTVEKLFDNRRIIVARRGHPLASATTLEQLQGAAWVRPSFSDRRDEADFEAIFERAGLPLPNIVMHSRSATVTVLAIANTDMLTILPIQWLDEFALGGQYIDMIPLEQPLHAAPVCIVRRGDLPLTPLAEGLCDMVRGAGLNYGMRLSAGR